MRFDYSERLSAISTQVATGAVKKRDVKKKSSASTGGEKVFSRDPAHCL
jgi:hypothetical protein